MFTPLHFSTELLQNMLAEAFASSIIENLHKDNPEVMNQFFRSLAKYRYSMQGCKNEFITETSVTDALKKNKSDQVLKIWMKGPKIAFFSVANTLIDTEFNWNGKTSRGARDNSKVFGDPTIIEEAFKGTPWSKLGLTKVYMIAFSSLKALGEGKQPMEVVDPKTEEVVKYEPQYVPVPKKGRKPSELKKRKNTSKKVKTTFKDGFGGTYQDDFTYYSGNADGWIMDKQGNKYDVNAGSYSSDQGYIAGGRMNYYAEINHPIGVIKLSGYNGVWSNPSSLVCHRIEADIADGMYLEDYLARHKEDISYNIRDKIKTLVDAGDPHAKSYEAIKTDIAEAKIANFYERYLVLPKFIKFEIEGGKAKIVNWRMLDDDRRAKDANPEYIEKRTDVCINGIVVPKINALLSALMKYTGLTGEIVAKDSSFNKKLALDTVEQKFVLVNMSYDEAPSITGDAILILNDFISINDKTASDVTKKMWDSLVKVWKKLNPLSKWVDMVKSRYHGRPKETQSLSSGNLKRYTIADCREIAINLYDEAMHGYQHELDSNFYGSAKIKRSYVGMPWKLVKEYIDGTFDIVEDVAKEMEQKPVEVKPIKLEDFPAKAVAEAKGKMQLWHEGKRKQNIGAMSDDKLKMNWAVCKTLGYDAQVAQLEAEAKKRNIVLQ